MLAVPPQILLFPWLSHIELGCHRSL